MLEPIPYAAFGFDPLACLADAAVLEACRFVVDPAVSGLEQIYRTIDGDDDQMWSVDIDGLVCPYAPICDPIVNSEVVRVDGSHLARTFARTITPAIDAYFKQNLILDP